MLTQFINKKLRILRKQLRKKQFLASVLLVVSCAGLFAYAIYMSERRLAVDPASYSQLLQLIAQAESKGNYNAYFSNASNTSVKFTNMSIAEVREWQAKFVQEGNASSAVGRYQIIDTTILFSTLSLFACPDCYHIGDFNVSKSNKQGLSVQFSINSKSCTWTHRFWTSKKPPKVRSFDVNKRIFYSMPRIGKGYAGLKHFLALMNLPPPMTKKNYLTISKKVHRAVKTVASKCMQGAAKELDTPGVDITDVGISNDGAW